ncbi:hypothetical protein D3227_27555 [Mesorhizobium waimense]|uniref:Uncharacterized protein n=1 Tax=Mesorhizobium waimense TaxID=1300307 RepID=A0A3A5KCH3_9HYPH|nr:hypothetical protein D3227_27555 [Mesorhizobium waimense]
MFEMHTDHGAPIVLRNSLQPLLEVISNSMRRGIKRFSDSREAARYEGVVAKLPPHLLYDIGDLDCILPPVSRRQIQHSYQEALEVKWQRSI